MSQYTAPTNLGNAPLALAAYLLAENYTAHARERVMHHVDLHGSLAGLVELGWLCPEDEAEATEVFVAHLPAEPWCSREWDDAGTWEVEPAEAAALLAAAVEAEADRRDAPEPFEPAEEDWEEYHHMFDAIDAMRSWYRSHPSFGAWLSQEGGPRP